MVNLYKMRALMRKAIRIRWRIERESSRATKTTTVITGMPRGGRRKDQTAEGAITIAEVKKAYKEVFDELEQMQNELNPLIDTLDNADDKAVMRLRYIDGYSPEDIAEAINRTERSVYYYISRAEDTLARKYPDKIKK